MGWLTVLLVLICIFIVPFIISNYLAKSMRSPESGFGLGVIICAILAASAVIYAALQEEQPLTYLVQEGDTVQSIAEMHDGLAVKSLTDLNNLQSMDDLKPGQELLIPNPKRLEIKRGVDLSGGVILIYEVDEEMTRSNVGAGGDVSVDIDALVEALARRINPGGVKEVVIRPYGEKQVEIIIPDVDDAEVDRLKRQITKAGYLRFMIMAKRADHAKQVRLAESQPGIRRVLDENGNLVAEWVRIAREEDGTALKVQVDPRSNLIREPSPGVVEVLMIYNKNYPVEGKHLASVSKGFDDKMAPAVNFTMGSVGAGLFRGLTSTNLPKPQTGRQSRLGIIMDGELISAPTIQSKISDRGQITGGFSEEYVDDMVSVLRAGRLPAVLKAEPITENRIDPLLGADTIAKGGFAISASLIAVLVFMLVYYRFAGIVACFALLLNLILILALMILIRGAFTLPGLAGLVLTVGMSVDANVLIFERIREELKRGTALRMAIRNGFARATTTIVDANITTLITAIVLYAIGTDQLRGFAVTLILGILMSMFTAIYCSRVIFDLAERRRWLKKLTMTQLLDQPKLNLVGMRQMAAVASVVLIVIGLVAVGGRRAKIFDIDFLGGTSVQATLKSPMPYTDVWDRLEGLAEDISLTQVNTENTQRDTVWKIDTSLEDNKELQDKLAEKFSENGSSLFVSHTVEFDPPTTVTAADTPAVGTAESTPDAVNLDAEATPESEAAIGSGDEEGGEEGGEESGAEADAPEATDGASTGGRTDLPGEHVLAFAEGLREELRVAQLDATTSGTVASVSSKTQLRFEQRVTRDTLLESLRNSAETTGIPEPTWTLTGPDGQADSAAGFRVWNVQANTDTANLSTILTKLKTNLESRPAWLSSSKIGGKVAGDTKNKAIAAILISLVCIVGYLWIRFQRVIFGLSAVVALVHDVLITLGAIAISAYLSSFAGFLLIDEFKISLPVVAAFLTIIGYSLNDTIVVFDRIREVRGRSPNITEEMINTSINQTLSRTLLTSLTTLIVVLILYIFGGQGIHGFAFALLVGVVVGTYSSIFVASPALLWMSKLQHTAGETGESTTKTTPVK